MEVPDDLLAAASRQALTENDFRSILQRRIFRKSFERLAAFEFRQSLEMSWSRKSGNPRTGQWVSGSLNSTNRQRNVLDFSAVSQHMSSDRVVGIAPAEYIIGQLICFDPTKYSGRNCSWPRSSLYVQMINQKGEFTIFQTWYSSYWDQSEVFYLPSGSNSSSDLANSWTGWSRLFRNSVDSFGGAGSPTSWTVTPNMKAIIEKKIREALKLSEQSGCIIKIPELITPANFRHPILFEKEKICWDKWAERSIFGAGSVSDVGWTVTFKAVQELKISSWKWSSRFRLLSLQKRSSGSRCRFETWRLFLKKSKFLRACQELQFYDPSECSDEKNNYFGSDNNSLHDYKAFFKWELDWTIRQNPVAEPSPDDQTEKALENIRQN